jgi:predicted lipoprotein with Yx(FWY)xxD motif
MARSGARGWRTPAGAARTAARPAGRPRAATVAVGVCAACALAVTSCGAASPAGPPRYEVRATTIGGLGKILADGAGFTLYMYVPDRRGPSKCLSVCAVAWPPLLLPRGVTRPKAGPGINPALLGTTRRADGALQVTYGKWPLYLWQGDGAPGQATGQAVDMGSWYVLSVTGSVDRGTPS